MLVLLLALILLLLDSHRAVIVELRGLALQQRGARAHEAAEAGLAWALAHLADDRTLDSRCEPVDTGTAGATAWRERLLRDDPAPGTRARRSDPGAGCVHDGGGWRCHCPDPGSPLALTAPDDDREHPAFLLTLTDGPPEPPGLLRLQVRGCHHLAAGCLEAGPREARAELATLLAPLGRLQVLPAATLTALGPVTLGDGSRVAQGDPRQGGWTVHAAGDIAPSATSRQIGPPGRDGASTLWANDLSLLDTDALWRRLFGLPAAAFDRSPVLHELGCAPAGCDATAVQRAIDSGRRALRLRGDLQVSGPQHWGDAERPLLLVVDGALSLDGAVTIDGLLIASRVDWVHTPGAGTARLRGALLSLGPVQLQGPVELQHDATQLERLRWRGGLYLPVPGSWTDRVE